MPLFSCGINHHSTPIHIRERLAVNATQMPEALSQLCRLNAVNEAVLLSTCHRTEIYMAGDRPDALYDWFTQHPGTQGLDMQTHTYQHQDLDAVRHLLRVGSGLDSMVLGEPQIFGQLKQAYQTACQAGTVGEQLQQLFPMTFSASKHIREQTKIGAHSVSMAYVTVQLAKRIFADLSNCRVLLIGAGELIELMLTHLSNQGVQHLIVANRTLLKAEQLKQNAQTQAIRIGDIPTYLPDIDIVITATASQLPIIGKGLIETTIKRQKRRPILMVDLALPRDIEPEVSQLPDIYLYNLDDLEAVINMNLKNRREAAKQAEALVELQATHYMRQLRISNASHLITQLRQQAEQHRDQTIGQALMALKQGKSPSDVIHHLAHQLTNKILHQPTLKLRQAAYHQQTDVLTLAEELLATEEV